MQVSLIIKVPLPVLKVLRPNKQITGRGVHIGSVAARWARCSPDDAGCMSEESQLLRILLPQKRLARKLTFGSL